MSNVIPFEQKAALPAHLQDLFDPSSAEDLITSSPSFSILSIKGSKWRIKMGDESHPILNEDDEPVPSIEVVVIDVSKGVSKNYYGKKYQEGDDAAPDCFSSDGISPDPASEKPQCSSCAACPHNVWGSRPSDNGSKGKACADSKVLAVTFASNLRNEELGGAMLLRVPPASLKDLSAFGSQMRTKGFLPQQIVMRLGFDMDVSYPKLTFKAVRPLNVDEVEVIGEMYQTEQVKAITGNTPPVSKSQPATQTVAKTKPVVDTEFEEAAPPAAAPKKAGGVRVGGAKAAPKTSPEAEVAPKTTRAAAQKAERKAAAEEATVVEPEETKSAIDSDIDDILGDLEGL